MQHQKTIELSAQDAGSARYQISEKMNISSYSLETNK